MFTEVETYLMKTAAGWKAFRRRLRRFHQAQGGGLLFDTVLLLAVFGLLGAAVSGALQSGYIAKGVIESEAGSENIIRNQLEDVFKQPYLLPTETASGCSPTPPPGFYCPITPPPDYTNFSVTAQALAHATSSPSQVTKVRITVTNNGQVERVFDSLRSNR